MVFSRYNRDKKYSKSSPFVSNSISSFNMLAQYQGYLKTKKEKELLSIKPFHGSKKALDYKLQEFL